MDRITPEIYIGALDDAGDRGRLANHGITAVLQLSHASPEAGYPRYVQVVQQAMFDGPRNDRARFEQAVSTLCDLLDEEETVLVHCSAGASRSVTVTAAALAKRGDRSLEAWLSHIAARREEADPHQALVERAVSVLDRTSDMQPTPDQSE